MAVVKMDSHRRIYVPREMAFDADAVIMLQQGRTYLVIPVPREPIEIDVEEGTPELKSKAESMARSDAIARNRRRRS